MLFENMQFVVTTKLLSSVISWLQFDFYPFDLIVYGLLLLISFCVLLDVFHCARLFGELEQYQTWWAEYNSDKNCTSSRQRFSIKRFVTFWLLAIQPQKIEVDKTQGFLYKISDTVETLNRGCNLNHDQLHFYWVSCLNVSRC